MHLLPSRGLPKVMPTIKILLPGKLRIHIIFSVAGLLLQSYKTTELQPKHGRAYLLTLSPDIRLRRQHLPLTKALIQQGISTHI